MVRLARDIPALKRSEIDRMCGPGATHVRYRRNSCSPPARHETGQGIHIRTGSDRDRTRTRELIREYLFGGDIARMYPEPAVRRPATGADRATTDQATCRSSKPSGNAMNSTCDFRFLF